MGETDAFYAGFIPGERRHGRAAHRPPGICRAAVVEAVLSLRRARLADGRSGRCLRRPPRATGPECKLDPPVQPRRGLRAGQMGIPVVRRLGPCVSHAASGATRPGLRQEATHPVPARMVYAPQRALPAYEFNLDDVNPPVHAWACWRVYKISGQRGARDRPSSNAPFTSCWSTSPGG